MSPFRTSRRKVTRFAECIAPLLSLLAFPIRAMAQPTGADSSGAATASSNPGGVIAIVVMVVALLVVIGVGVKFYDLKRKREDDVMSLQSRISDALLLDPSLAGLPITAFASGPLWRRSRVVIAVRGPVPTPELRAAVMRLVEKELSSREPGARAEDRMVVDPLMGKHVA